MKFGEASNANANQEIDEEVWNLVEEEWKQMQEERISEENKKKEDEKRQAEEKRSLKEMWKNDKLSRWEWKKKIKCRENVKDSSTQADIKFNIPGTVLIISKIVNQKVKDASSQTDSKDFLKSLHFELPDLTSPEASTSPQTESKSESVNCSPKKTKNKCWNCGSPLHLFPNCEFPKVKCFCFRCGEPGTKRTNCPKCNKKLRSLEETIKLQNGIFCYRCGKVGVTIPTCPNCKEAKEFSET